MRRRIQLIVLSGALVTAGCVASRAATHQDKALDELRTANYKLAYQEIQLALEAAPDDSDVQRLEQQLRVLFLLDEQRRRIFAGEEGKALQILARVLTLDPRNETAKRWQDKARAQLGAKLVLEAEEDLKAQRLEVALAKFQRALSYVPGDERARRGLRRVSEIYTDQREHANKHYLLALRAREDADWRRVFYHATTSSDTDPTHADAPSLHAAAVRRLALERRSWAQRQEELGLWAAAAKAWRGAEEMAREAGLDWADQAAAKVKSMADEQEANRLFGRAEVKIAGGAFDEARALIQQADPLCTNDRVVLNELLAYLDRRELEFLLRRADLLAADHRHEEALEIFKRVAKRDASGRARARIQGIEELLASCKADYEKAERAVQQGRVEEARSIWRGILSVHRRYRDVRARYDGK